MIILKKGKHFRFCSNCGGIFNLENSCQICNELDKFDPTQLQNDLKSLFFPSTKEINNDFAKSPKINLKQVLNQVNEKKDENKSHFLKIEDGEPYIWHPCPECDGKFREITVLTLNREEECILFGICGHDFEEKLPLDLVERIENELK